MINFVSSWCCLSEESSAICVASCPSLVCLFSSVVIASSSIGEYSRILQDDQENITLINTLILLGVTGILSGIFSMSNCLQIILQLSTAPVCIKIQKYWQTCMIPMFLSGIIIEYYTIPEGKNSERIHSQLLNMEIVLGILIIFTITSHLFC